MGAADVIRDQTRRSIKSLRVVMDDVPDEYWDALYCDMPLWKHVYHTLHSLDRWYINPLIYDEPGFHTKGLNDLDAQTQGRLSRDELNAYFTQVERKILAYADSLFDDNLNELPEGNEYYTRLHYIVAQLRHLDMHIGILMGFLIAGKGLWPEVLGIDSRL